MTNETKYCITAIIIALIWLAGQPMNISGGGEIHNLPYFNLDNSTINGHASIQIPLILTIPAIIIEITQYNNVMILLLILALFYIILQIKKHTSLCLIGNMRYERQAQLKHVERM